MVMFHCCVNVYQRVTSGHVLFLWLQMSSGVFNQSWFSGAWRVHDKAWQGTSSRKCCHSSSWPRRASSSSPQLFDAPPAPFVVVRLGVQNPISDLFGFSLSLSLSLCSYMYIYIYIYVNNKYIHIYIYVYLLAGIYKWIIHTVYSIHFVSVWIYLIHLVMY